MEVPELETDLPRGLHPGILMKCALDTLTPLLIFKVPLSEMHF